MKKRLWLTGILILCFCFSVLAAENVSFTKMWKGEDLWQFGGGKYAGGENPKEWQGMPGSSVSFHYSGTGPLPAPVEFVIPISKTLPLGGNYRLFVKNFYRGKMEATLGDITKPLRIVRYDWTVGETFEVNAPVDKIILKYFPSDIVQDTGAVQEQHYIIQGVFLTTEPFKVPIRGGEIVELLPADKPVSLKGNYLENASFEAGLCGWGKVFQTSYVFDSDNLDSTTAADGKSSLKWTLGEKSGIETKLYRMPADAASTLSFYARSEMPAAVRAEVVGLSEDLKNYAPAGLGSTFNMEPQWKRYSISGKLKPLPGFLYTIHFSATPMTNAPATLWLDAVQLEEGEMTPFAIREDVQVGYISRIPGNIFYSKDPCNVDVVFFNSKDKYETMFKYSIVDFWGKEVARGEKKISLAGKKNETLPLALPATKTGIFRASFSAEDSESEMVYSVLPPNLNLNKKYEAGTLGVDTDCRSEKNLSILKRANFNWVISKFYGRWYLVEPEKGKYQFNDENLKRADQAKIMVLLQPLNPGWGIQPWLKEYIKPAGGAVWQQDKKDMFLKHWGEFIYALVSHYKDYVKYWEIENEPNCVFSGAEYGEILKIASRNARKADPEARIVGFSGGGYGEKFYAEGIKVAGESAFDIFSVHFYGNAFSTHEAFSALLKKYNKPGWNTETGNTCPTFFTTLPHFEQYRMKNYWQDVQQSVRDTAVSAARNYLISLSVGGMAKYFWYFCRFANCGPSQPTSWGGGGKELVEYDGSLRANAVALSIASHYLDGSKFHGRVDLDKRLDVFTYEKGAGSRGFLWALPGQALSIAPGGARGLEFYDIMGNALAGKTITVTDSPIYFTSEGDVEKLERDLKNTKVESGKKQ